MDFRFVRTGERSLIANNVAVLSSLLEGSYRAKNRKPTDISSPEIIKPEFGKTVTFAHGDMEFSIIWKSKATLNKVSEGYTMALSKNKAAFEWRLASKEGRFENVNGIISPPGTRYTIKNTDGPIYLASMRFKNSEAMEQHFDSPVGFSNDDVMRHLLGNEDPVKLMVPLHPNGHELAEGGSTILSTQKKNLVLGPENQEFSAGGPDSRQDFHLHRDICEIYLAFDTVKILYTSKEGRIEEIEASGGNAIVVKPGTPHYAILYGETPSFVMMGSPRPLVGDKHVVLPHNKINALANAFRAN